ncbi:MAG: DHA2 family efflux MFS transporter permease subunit [Chloroflexi bacterium]|nr:DHA2 family efflux MFS transporter permease subunit [Chloroflexota bacterium]
MAAVATSAGAVPSGAAPARRAHALHGLAYHWQAMIVIVLGSFMVVLDTTIVNIALPRIIQVFQTNVNEGQLVLTGYMLALAVVMPATGFLSDALGAKRTYIVTIALFTIGSALCGLAPNIEGLVLFRILQGLGGGLVQPLGMSILLQAAPPHQRGSIMGIFGLPILVAPVIGPTLGGYLVEYVDWRVIFTLNVPIGIAAVFMAGLLLRETPRRGIGRFDWPGFVLSAIGFSAAMLALEKAPQDGWTAPHIMVLWMITAVAIPAWVVVELSQDQPLLDLGVLRDRTYLVATLVALVATAGMYSSLLLLPLFLQNVRGLGAMESGMLLFPQAVTAGIMMPISGKLLDKLGPKPVVIPGLLLLGYATWLLVSLDPSTPDDSLRVILMLRGAAMGLMMMPVMTVAMDTIPPMMIPRASALSNVLRQLFGAFATGIFASLLLDRTVFHTAVLSQTVTSWNIAAVNVLNAAQGAFMQKGLSEAAAHSLGLQALASQVALKATVQSFDDCFFIGTLVTLAGVVPALWLKRGHHPAAHGAGAGPVLE